MAKKGNYPEYVRLVMLANALCFHMFSMSFPGMQVLVLRLLPPRQPLPHLVARQQLWQQPPPAQQENDVLC